jgi:hypothetical protein
MALEPMRPVNPATKRREPGHEIEVISVSPEEAVDGIAELWAGGELVAFTHFEDSDLMLRSTPAVTVHRSWSAYAA